MSKHHGVREQKRRAKQKDKREARRQNVARLHSSDPTVRLKSAERWPIEACLVPDNLWEMGLGNLIIARKMPNGQLACASFLVDVYCLGVKNVLWKIFDEGEFHSVCRKLAGTGRFASVAPEYFAKLVDSAADYARSLGFSPHPDFRHVRILLAGIDPSHCKDEFEFGKDGRPLYIRGPSETIAEARAIAARLQAVGGHFVVAGDASELSPQLVDQHARS